MVSRLYPEWLDALILDPEGACNNYQSVINSSAIMLPTQIRRSVGRPRVFDEQQALEAAMDVFWTSGYEATSLVDLCQATGLHKGSLYQAFGDKHAFFMRALQHYIDRAFRETAAVAFQHESPLASVRAVVRTICKDAKEGRGCLMVNALVELAPHDEAVQKVVAAEGGRRLRVLTDLIMKARQAGEIRPELEPHQLARQLMLGFAGSAAMVKGLMTTEQVTAVLEGMIDTWA
jgi:TetR/AcrR family transcriptional regulator, transcriptional repressor for nem operon